MAVRWPQVGRTSRAGILAVMLCVAGASCASQQPAEPAPAADLPVDAAADQVLDAYLAAFKANDCQAAARFAGPDLADRGGLCGAVTIDSFDREQGRAVVGNEAIFAVELNITSGTLDGSPPRNPVTWFFRLQHQAGGPWKIVEGGSGP